MNQNQDIPSIIEQVATHAVAENFSEARKLLASLDLEAMANERTQLRSAIWSPSRKIAARPSIKVKRTGPTNRLKLEVFRRDKFTCRYAHCQRKTIYIPVLKELSRLFPTLLPYHPNWKPVSDHLLYWVYSTSIEHKLSFPHGGDSAELNLITACYGCNDAKNYLHLSDLAWEITDIPESGWDGLEQFLGPLRKVSMTTGSRISANRPRERKSGKSRDFSLTQPALITPGSLIRARLPGKQTIRHYRVDQVSKSAASIIGSPRQSDTESSTANSPVVILREMWRTDKDRTWVISKRSQSCRLDE